MTALRRISLGLVALLVLLLGAAWLLPPFLDWSRYRDDVAVLATAALGQPVHIRGPVSLRVLPQPFLAADGVSVDISAGTSVRAEQLRLRVGLAPLLAGRVEARELVLLGADIRLPWPLDPASLTLRVPSWLSALSARIERGRLQIGEWAMTGLEASLATSDTSGSFLSSGRLRSGGRDWSFTARVSQPGGDGAVGVDVTFDGQGPGQGTGATVSGQLQPDGAMLGRVTLRGTDLSQLMPAPPVPFRVDGRLTTGGGLVAADELVGELAGAPVKGAIALRLLPLLRLDVALAASRLDLDSWAPALLRGTETGFGGLRLGIDLSAEAAPWAGGTVRAVRGAVDIVDGGVDLRDLRAMLPGDAALRLKGRIVTVPAQQLHFDGEVGLEAPSLRTTLAWAAKLGLGPVDALPDAVLRSASLQAKVAVADGEMVLSDLAGQVDGSAVLAVLGWRPFPRPALRAIVTAERADLDAWLPKAWPGLPAMATAFGAMSLDVQMQAEQSAWQGVPIAPLSIDLTSAPGRIELRQLHARTLGASLAASGTLLEGGRLSDAKADMRTERATGLGPPIAQLLGADAAARLEPLLRGAAQVQVQASGTPSALSLRLVAALADLRLEATPTLDLSAGQWAGALLLRHPGAPRLAEMFGLPAASTWLGDGSLALVAQLSGGAGGMTAESFTLAAGGTRAAGTLRLELGPVPRLTGRISAESLMLPLPFARNPDPFPLATLAGWAAALQVEAGAVSFDRERVLEEMSAALTLADGKLAFSDVMAKMAGGRLTGSLAVDTAVRPPTLAAQATLRGARVTVPLFETAIDIVAGTLDAEARLGAAGFSPAGLLASLEGAVSLMGRDGSISGLNLERMGARLEEADLRAALSKGATAFDRLTMEADIARGGATLRSATLAGVAGIVTATGTIDLTQAVLALRLAIRPAVPDPPEIGLRLLGPADMPERIPELAGATRWRAEHPP